MEYLHELLNLKTFGKRFDEQKSPLLCLNRAYTAPKNRPVPVASTMSEESNLCGIVYHQKNRCANWTRTLDNEIRVMIDES